MPFSKTTATKAAGPKKIHQAFAPVSSINEGTAVEITAEEAAEFAPAISKKAAKAIRKEANDKANAVPLGPVGWVTVGDGAKLKREIAEKAFYDAQKEKVTVIGNGKATKQAEYQAKKAEEKAAREARRKAALNKIVCYDCGKTGHVSARCFRTHPDLKAAHVAKQKASGKQ